MLLRADVDVSNIRLDNPARVRTIATTGDDWVFPLRDEYERVNRSLNGAREKEADPTGDRHQQRLDGRREAEERCRLILAVRALRLILALLGRPLW